MALTRSPEVDAAARDALLRIGRHAIVSGLLGRPAVPDVVCLDGVLVEQRASFVTLTNRGALRGCTGSLEATRTLAEDVADNAYNTAFHDRRFSPLRSEELDDVRLEISVLSPLTPLAFADEPDLLQQLERLRTGVVLDVGTRRATFLPKVWEGIANASEFLSALKRKAGLEPAEWPAGVRVYLYGVESFGEVR